MYNNYSDQEENTLTRMFNEFLSLPDIALALGRSKHSVQKKINELGLKRNYRIVVMVSKYGLDVLERINPDSGLLVTKCNKGHDFDEANTYRYRSPNNGRIYRQCKACRRLRAKVSYKNDPVVREQTKARAHKQRHGDGADSKRTDTHFVAQAVKG